ncbi:hypothetical protein AMAG_19403 [Allomyces macrogynus ATCC 38327]|uniref:F-box domain-containing protein n=1 Tax=Allomyces macrogynus (strain ATCC 38327) TaxID=578462 RepID=A0A0L0SR28_ALLM3|nr:hypothetical protein AMAG_19403 [Allomyces macrogynus ATCC 38327]|eukprot:KNE64957.1 hypothetical protein AMAG_19403 [Allomyces macrogynus ATCC 38327]
MDHAAGSAIANQVSKQLRRLLPQRSPIERLPYDLLSSICHWILRTGRSDSASRATLLRFAVASASFFEPAVHVALRDRNPSVDPFIFLEWKYSGSNLHSPGQYVILPHHSSAQPQHVYLALAPRNHRRLEFDPGTDEELSWWWTTVAIPLEQIMHAHISLSDTRSPWLISPHCRYLTISDGVDDDKPWPVYPSSVQALTLTNVRESMNIVVASFHEALRELSIGLASIDDDDALSDLYNHLPATLVVLKVLNHDCSYPPDLGNHSCFPLSQALARLMHLTVFHHELLFCPTHVVYVVDGLARAVAAGKSASMRSLELTVEAELDDSPSYIWPARQKRDFLIDNLSLNLDMYYGPGLVLDDYTSFLVGFIRAFPAPRRSIKLDAPSTEWHQN